MSDVPIIRDIERRAIAEDRKQLRAALLAGVEEASFAIGLLGVKLPGKVALRTADVLALIQRVLPEERPPGGVIPAPLGFLNAHDPAEDA